MKNLTFITILLVCSYVSNAQSVIAEWNFQSPADSSMALGGIEENHDKHLVHIGDVNPPSYDSSGFEANAAASTGWINGENTHGWMAGFTTLGYENISISSRQFSSIGGPRYFILQYKIGADAEWRDLPNGTVEVRSDWESGKIENLRLPDDASNRELVYVRWLMSSNTAVNGGPVQQQSDSRIDMVRVKGTSSGN